MNVPWLVENDDSLSQWLTFTRWRQLKHVYFHTYLGKVSNLTSIFFKWVGSTTNQFKLLGIRGLIRQIKLKLLFQGPNGWVSRPENADMKRTPCRHTKQDLFLPKKHTRRDQIEKQRWKSKNPENPIKMFRIPGEKTPWNTREKSRSSGGFARLESG